MRTALVLQLKGDFEGGVAPDVTLLLADLIPSVNLVVISDGRLGCCKEPGLGGTGALRLPLLP